jgi:predicted acyltransferase
MGCNFPQYLDQKLLDGHLWGIPNVQDPDGVGAILPAVSTTLCGVLAGHLLRIESIPRLRISWLMIMGLLLIFAATLLSAWIPVNKPLWTTSYAFLMAGLASIGFAACYWIVDVLHWGSPFKALEILGMNALTAFMISALALHVPKVHFFGRSLYEDVCRQLASPPNASLMYSIAYLIAVYLIVWFMYWQRWSLKNLDNLWRDYRFIEK